MRVTPERRARALLCALAALGSTLFIGVSTSGRAGAVALSARAAVTTTLDHAWTSSTPPQPNRMQALHHNAPTLDLARADHAPAVAPASTAARSDVSAGSTPAAVDAARTRGPPGGSVR